MCESKKHPLKSVALAVKGGWKVPVTAGVAWHPISNKGGLTSCVRKMGGESKKWMLRQPVSKNKGCLSIQFLLREFCKDSREKAATQKAAI